MIENGKIDPEQIVLSAEDLALLTEEEIADYYAQAAALNEQVGSAGAGMLKRIEAVRQKVSLEKASHEARRNRFERPYVISPELEKVVEVARILNKPLLLEGEPGTGKTALAYALAVEDGTDVIHVRGKSSLSAKDIMYTIDSVARLRDVHLASELPDAMKEQASRWADYIENGGDPNRREFRLFMQNMDRTAKLMNAEKVGDLNNYIQYGELGQAIIRAAQGERVILLIDEIDKAKREFPNDLLDELEHLTIRITETGQEISAPRGNILVIVTSNHERDLPEPFLRRCVYHFIKFPDRNQMSEIVLSHFPDVPEKLLESALVAFYNLRLMGYLEKQPSTSEMLDWIKVLLAFNVDEIGEEIPFAETLLKIRDDYEKVFGFQARQERIERMKASSMSEAAVAALAGKTVFRVAGSDNYNGDRTLSRIQLALANAGIPFETEKQYDNNQHFTILAPGLTWVDNYTFACDNNPQAQEVYQLLMSINAIDNVWEVTDGDVTFSSILFSNKDFIHGKDDERIEVYKTSDGQVVRVKPVEYVTKGAFARLRLTPREAAALEEAGITSPAKLKKKIETDGDQSILDLPGIGVRVLAQIKRFLKENDVDEDEDDNGNLRTIDGSRFRTRR